jgi:2'-5' RNA ligase
MAMIGIQAPPDVCKKMAKIKVPGKKLDADEYHITLFYIEEEFTFKSLVEYIAAMLPLMSDQKPFKVSIDHVETFPKGPDGVPLICPVKSSALKKFRELLAKKFDKEKLKYSKRFPEYKPHLTLAYHDEEFDKKEFETVEWEVEAITIFSDYRKVKNALVLDLPLGKKLAIQGGDLFLKLSSVADIFDR